MKRQRDTKEKSKKRMKMFKNVAIEKKAITIGVTASEINGTSGAIGSLMANLLQGNNYDERIGNKVQLLNLQWKIEISYASTVTPGSGAFDIVLDKKPTGTLPNVNAVFNGFHPADFLLFRKNARYKCLTNRFWGYDSASLNRKYDCIGGYIDLKKRTVSYTGDAGNITDLADGQNDLLYIFRSSNTGGGGVSYGVNADIRVVYIDV